jgi:hypothetical protein
VSAVSIVVVLGADYTRAGSTGSIQRE